MWERWRNQNVAYYCYTIQTELLQRTARNDFDQMPQFVSYFLRGGDCLSDLGPTELRLFRSFTHFESDKIEWTRCALPGR